MSGQPRSAPGAGKARTSFRLVDLTGRGKDVRIEAGQPATFAAGLTLHLNPETREALLEADGVKNARVDGKPIIDVAHVRAGSLIEAGDERFVFLAPFQVYVNPAADRAALLGKVRLLNVVHDATGLPSALSAASAASDAALPSQSATGVAKDLGLSRSRGRKVRLAVMGVAAAALAGFLLVPLPKPGEPSLLSFLSPKAGEVKKPKAKRKAAPRKVVDAAATPAPAPVAAAPAPAAPAPAVAAAPAGEAKPVVEAKPAAPAKPAKVKEKKKKKEAEAEAAPAVKDVPEEKLAKQREQYREFVLEAKFDPEGVRRKLDVLAKKIPANSQLARDIAKLRKSLN